LPPSVVNPEVGLLRSSLPDVASVAERSMEEYQEPAKDWSRPVVDEMEQKVRA
jgi:hypothetical protein